MDSEQQMRRYNRDNLGTVIQIFPSKHICDPPLAPSHRDGSNEGSQYMLSLRYKEKYFRIIFNTHSYLELWDYFYFFPLGANSFLKEYPQ